MDLRSVTAIALEEGSAWTGTMRLLPAPPAVASGVGAAAAGARGAAGGAGSVAVAVGACRALVRSGLIETVPRRCRGEKWRPWERGSPMELWQMDVVGGIGLADGSELKALTGSAGLTRRPCSSVGSAAGWDQSRPRSRARSRASERDATPSFW